MTYKNLKDRLDAGEIIVLDGGTGTELQRRGAQMDPSAWCGPASLNNSELLTQVHLDYIDAGADVVTANTFASSRLMLTPAGYADQVEEINRIAVEAALRARDLATKQSPSRKIAVAGSLSHMKVGDTFTAKNLRAIRPGYGLAPKFYDDTIGKTVKRDVVRGTPLSHDLIA